MRFRVKNTDDFPSIAFDYFFHYESLMARSGHSSINPIAQLTNKDKRQNAEVFLSRDRVLCPGMPVRHKFLNQAFIAMIDEAPKDADYLLLGFGRIYINGKPATKKKRAASVGLSVGAFDTRVSRAVNRWRAKERDFLARQNRHKMR